jgi:hypothetical protein
MPSLLPLLAFSGWLPKNCFGLGKSEQRRQQEKENKGYQTKQGKKGKVVPVLN